jgi:predicted DNA-binding protein (MmcQ/YjbR family)
LTRKELIDLCLISPDAAEDYPFDDGGESTIMRHRSNSKWFALIFELDGRLCINLKCEPMQADFWRGVYEGVIPAWHMNKVHWNTVYVNSDVKILDLRAMIRDSFELTSGARKTVKKIEKSS